MQHVAYTGELALFSVNQIAREIFLDTATRYESAIKHANFLSYRPKLPTAASVALRLSSSPSTSNTGTITVQPNTQVTIDGYTWYSPTGLSYSWNPTFPFNSNNFSLALVNSKPILDTFTTHSGPAVQSNEYAASQSFTTVFKPVIEGSVKVTVNGVAWDYYESLLIAGLVNAYTLSSSPDGAVKVTFGDGFNGRIPPSAALVEVSYQIGGGYTGNIPANSLIAKIPVTVNGSVQTLQWYNPAKADGGRNRESVSSIKANAPAWHFSTNRAITALDYPVILKDLSGSNGIPVVAHTVTKLRHDDGTYLGTEMLDVDSYVWIYLEDGTIGPIPQPAALLLQEAINTKGRSLICVHNNVHSGTVFPVQVNLGIVNIAPAYEDDLPATIALIESAIRTYFLTLSPGEPCRVSRIYSVVLATRRVNYFSMQLPSSDITPDPLSLCTLQNITGVYQIDPGF
jgi:hypothetical protein